jgi:hypothetical protein
MSRDVDLALYRTGLSMREVSRRTGLSLGVIRHRLVKGGLHRIKHKQIRDGMATCNQCGERQSIDQFPQLTYGKYQCRMCLREAQEDIQLRRQGWSKEQYRTLLEAQDGKCAICGVGEGHRSRYGRVCRLAVDHDHQNGKVRGLLCNSCNRGLGRFKDSIENLEAAIRYLKREQ